MVGWWKWKTSPDTSFIGENVEMAIRGSVPSAGAIFFNVVLKIKNKYEE